MANLTPKTINELPEVTELNGSDLFAVMQSATSKKAPFSKIASMFVRNYSRKVILIGDSYGLDNAYWTGWQTEFDNLSIYPVYKSAVGGSGFIGDPNESDFLTQLTNLSVSDKNSITDIVVMGGYNDTSMGYSEAELITAVQDFSAYCEANYPYAKVCFGFIAVSYNNDGRQAELNSYCSMFARICSKTNISFIPNAQYILLDRSKIFLASGNANSGFHPNTTGNQEVAKKLAEYLASGYFDVVYGEQVSRMNVYVKNGECTILPESYPLLGKLPSMTYPFGEWTTLIDSSLYGDSNFLWGTHSPNTTAKFTLFIRDNSGGRIHALFRLYDKKVEINPMYESDLTLGDNAYVCIESITIPMQMNY